MSQKRSASSLPIGRPYAGSSFLQKAGPNGQYYMTCGRNLSVSSFRLDDVLTEFETNRAAAEPSQLGGRAATPVGLLLLDAEHHEQVPAINFYRK